MVLTASPGLDNAALGREFILDNGVTESLESLSLSLKALMNHENKSSPSS